MRLHGTPITNRPINFFNMLRIIGSPIADDWKTYAERYCDGKFFYNKKERNAHTQIYLRKIGKASWYDLTYDEKNELNAILDKKCRKMWSVNGSSNIDELQEVIKPYYLRRLKSEFGHITKKDVTIIRYALNEKDRMEYDSLWENYVRERTDKTREQLEKHKTLIDGTLKRQWLSSKMVDKTIQLVWKKVAQGHKVVVFCSYDEELYRLKDAFGSICVYHNGKLTAKKKDAAVEAFQTDPRIRVFIGNIHSARSWSYACGRYCCDI